MFFYFAMMAYGEDGLTSFRPAEGGFRLPPSASGCLDDGARQRIWKRLRRNMETLKLDSRGAGPELIWPVVQNPVYNDVGFWAITNFVDHDPAFPDALRDFQGGRRTYDTAAGYNHAGTDIFLWPSGWEQMDREQAWVVAAAAGTIIGKDDGFFDQNCTLPPPNPNWNAVYIQHADGSVAWYGHLKNNSLTTKPVGASVVEGEYLGVVGSSGVSTGPHLHFEIYDPHGNLNDPYTGPYNDMNNQSWWLVQPDYIDPAMVRLMTHDDAPGILSFCPEDEIIHRADVFTPGARVYISIWYRDQQQGQITSLALIQPNGSPFAQWNHQINEPHLAASFWYWYWDLPANAEEGVWTLQAVFEDQPGEHHFVVGSCPSLYHDHLSRWPRDIDIKDLARLIPCSQASR
jgi:hypothetical protein